MHWTRKMGWMLGVFGVLTWAWASPALGEPTFVIETESEWQDAMTAGQIQPVDPGAWSDYMTQWNLFQEEGDPYPPHEFLPPDPLYVWGGGGGGGANPEDAGLVMAWGDPIIPPPDGSYSSAWRFDYLVDPDLSNSAITITVTPPSASGINVVSFGMQDIFGNVRAWYWNCGPAGPLPWDTPTAITINTSLTGTAATSPPASAYMNNPGFDITQVQWFIVDENAQWVGMVGVPPPGQLMPAPWNYWHNLIVLPFQGPIKWAQPPTHNDFSPFPECYWGWDEFSLYELGPIVADDWLCEDDRPITDIHWWGSYLNWNEEGPPPDAPDMFHIAIWTDVDVNSSTTGFSHPGRVLHQWWVPRTDLYERHAGCDFHPDYMMMPDSCFQYDFFIPEGEWFWQEPGPTVYWISISAVYQMALPQHLWGWKTREHFYNDDAVRIFDPVTPAVGYPYVLGEPIEDMSGESWDMAFVLTSDRDPIPSHELKWDQPPVPIDPDNVFYGWNEYSVWDDDSGIGRVAADDWYCDTPDPITKIRWWGSFIGWTGVEPPELPDGYYIDFWTDVPAGVNTHFSHPGLVIHEIFCTNFTWQWVGWDYNPATGDYESCFLFEQDLLPHEYFYQESGNNIYWLSIAAWYPNVSVTYPWGWKTRPRDPASLAPDDAVRIFDPSAPTLGTVWVNGEPIFWPTEAESWDLAFELIAAPQAEIKWLQPFDPGLSGLHSHDYDGGGFPGYDYVKCADDFQCQGGDITTLRWWGNFELDALGVEMRGAGVAAYQLSLHTTSLMPGPSGFLVPNNPAFWQMDVSVADINVVDTGIVNLLGSPIYEYTYELPNAVSQTPQQWYWLDVMALSVDPLNPPMWHWQESARSAPYLGHAPGVERTSISPWDSIIWGGGPTETYSDFAFEITSGAAGDPYVKWSQPPEPYVPDDGYNGWNEMSIFGDTQIVADDWLCTNGYPVTDFHWWGSFIGWGYQEPPQIPDAFHIGIWTDVPAGVDAPYSHPGMMLWENWCDTFTWRFVGWDWDPRDQTLPPEACFRFDQVITDEALWFYQEPGDNIYWVSISAVYLTGQPIYPWGWKTRPRDNMSPAPDDAVVIWDPTAPVPGMLYGAGGPLWWPTPEDSWDMAFQLTTLPTCLKADVNCDGTADILDMGIVRQGPNWNQTPPAVPRADVNGDGTADVLDLGVIRQGTNWNVSTGPCNCPP